MDSRNKGAVFKGLLNEFSSKPYISMSHNVYPIDDDEGEVQAQTPPDSDVSESSSENEIDDPNNISLKPKKNQLVEVAKLNIFVNLSPQDFLEIKKQFTYYDNNVNTTQFVLIVLDVLTTSAKLTEKNQEFVKAIIYLYQMIDVYGYNSITFDEFSNFLVEMHEILNRDQELFEIKLNNKKLEKALDHVPMDKLFELTGYNGFAYLEQNLKTIRVVSPTNWEEVLNVQIGATTIVAAYYIKQKNCLLISSNDKFLNFFDMQTNKLQRRFMVPDVQTFIQCSKRKGIIYSGAINGTMYSWDLEKIFSKEFFKAMGKHPDCFKLVLNGHPINNHEGTGDKSSEKSLQIMLLIEALEIMATGSSDTIIRLFENKKKLIGVHKELRGHAKAIKDLSYCAQYKYLISCSYDFDVLIWNVYLDHPLARLVGHEAPLLTILTVQQRRPHRFSLILSCDAKGVLRVWDPKTFQTIQLINVTDGGEHRVKSIIFKQESNLVMLGYKQLQLYEVDQSYDPNLTDDQPLICMVYSDMYLELHIGTTHHIKTWDCGKGVLKRILKNVGEGAYITTMVLDKTQRRIFVGLHTGQIVMVDVFTGFKINEFNDLTKEVCYLGYSTEYNLLVAVSWDKQVRIFKDINDKDKKPDKNLTLRIIKNSHVQEVIQGAFSEHLMLIATSTRDGDIRLWDFEKGNFVCKLKSTGKEISALRFLDPFPLLVSSDTSGTLCINIVRPHKLESQIAVVWKNMFTIMKSAQVLCLEHSSSSSDDLKVILGDENGDIRILDLSEVIKHIGIKPVPIEEMAQNKNLHRFFQLIFTEYENQAQEKPITEGLANEKQARQIFSWKAHKVGIKSTILVRETQDITLITLGNDRLVKLWNLKGTLLGVFRQGVDSNTINYPFRLIMKPTYQTEVDKTYQAISLNFDASKIYKDKLKKSKTVPFKKEEEEFGALGHVESKEIFKDLQEISKYLDKRNDQGQKLRQR